jgi:hypothetical protein
MKPVDLNRVRTIPLETRPNKVALAGFAKPPKAGRSFAEFVASLPGILIGNDFREVVAAIVAARRNGRPVIVGMGAHVIKCGLNPVLIDLMRRGIVSAIALNGSGAIHDFEIALIGETSEDVAAGLREGTFGMVRETGELFNQGVNDVLERRDAGMGALLAEQLERVAAPHREHSLLDAGRRLNVPVTVHVAIGTDIVHMHASANGAALGLATFNDFRIFAAAVAGMRGGVYLNIGSAVILPEVFLKAFTIAQNLGAGLRDFVTVNMDMTAHYRPGENVLRRPAAVGGKSFTLLGRHEIMVPLLAQAVVEVLGGV